MSSYVDGFIVPVPKKNLAAYRRQGRKAGKVWREHGALDYREYVADDVKVGKWTSFPRSGLIQVTRASRQGQCEGDEGSTTGRHDGSENAAL